MGGGQLGERLLRLSWGVGHRLQIGVLLRLQDLGLVGLLGNGVGSLSISELLIELRVLCLCPLGGGIGLPAL